MSFFLLLSCLLLSGCFGFSKEMLEALAHDTASFCGKVSASGGAGGMAGMLPSGGYGTSTLEFCRSNQPNARVTMDDKGISIEHWEIAKDE
jgi:hypothetical protein